MEKNIEELISSYIENDISESEKNIIENQIKNNPEFSLKVNNMRKIMASLNDMPIMEPSQDFVSRLDENINSSEANKNYWFTTDLKTTFGFSITLGVILFFIFNSSATENNTNINLVIDENSKNNFQLDVATEQDTSLTNEFPILQVDYNE